MAKNDQGYISNELAHFVGRKQKTDKDSYEILRDILKNSYLTHDPHAPRNDGVRTFGLGGSINVDFSSNEMYVPNMVCFCDIPTTGLSIHMEKYGNFGLSFSKDFIVNKGGRPVFYVPKGAVSPISDYQDIAQYFTPNIRNYQILFDNLKSAAPIELPQNIQTLINEHPNIVTDLKWFFDYNIFSFIKTFDHTLSDEDKNNYYFEREWRVLGDVEFSIDEVKRIFIPKSFEENIQQDFPDYKGAVFPI